MSEQSDKAQRIKETMGTAGWQDIAEIIEDGISGPRSTALELMTRDPDKVSLKTLSKYANQSKGVEKVKENIEDALKPLNSPQPARAGTQ